MENTWTNLAAHEEDKEGNGRPQNFLLELDLNTKMYTVQYTNGWIRAVVILLFFLAWRLQATLPQMGEASPGS